MACEMHLQSLLLKLLTCLYYSKITQRNDELRRSGKQRKLLYCSKARNKAERVNLSNKTHADRENRDQTSKQLKVSVNRAVETFEHKLAANTDIQWWALVTLKVRKLPIQLLVKTCN